MASDSYPTNAEQPFHVMTKPNGPACNLECEYCFYLDKADFYPEQSDFRMDDETLETFVRQYFEAQPGPVVSFAWQGGEPTLLGLEFFRRVVELQRKHAPDGVRVENAIQTNGTLLDEEWCRFLAEHDFLVGISIDGPRDLHDQFRQTQAGGATFNQVTEGLTLLQEFNVEYNVLCVVNAVNSCRPLDVYDFFRRRGVKWIQFIPLVEPLDAVEDTAVVDASSESETASRRTDESRHSVPGWVCKRGGDAIWRDDNYDAVVKAARNASVSERSVDPVAYGEFMCTIFDEWVRNDVGEVSVQLFDQCLEVLLHGDASLCMFQETCGSQVALEHNGDVYACDHFVNPGFERGNIHDTHLSDLVDAPEQRQFGEYKRDGLPSRCQTYPIYEFCHGGCPKNWQLTTPGGEPGLNYLCAGYRCFFMYVQPYLELFERVVDRGLPLQYVMQLVDSLDARSN